MSGQLYPSFGLSGVTKSRGVSGTTKSSKNALDVNVVGTDSNNYTLYEAKSFTITGAQTDYDIGTTQSMFDTVATAKSISVYVDVAATLKLNATGNSGIGIIAGEEINLEGLPTTNLFMTTTADTVVRVILLG